MLSDLSISDDGSTVTFLRGGAAELTRLDRRAEQRCRMEAKARSAATKTNGTGAWRLGQGGTAPALSPDGRTVAFARDGEIYSYQSYQNARGFGGARVRSRSSASLGSQRRSLVGHPTAPRLALDEPA